MPSPPVSVIIPAHNAASTLGETLDSLRVQTYAHWEAVVIENGSTDRTAAVAGEYARLDARIRVHLHPGSGVSSARNAGLDLARHHWVLFLDADDWIVADHLETMIGHLQARPELDAVHCGWARVTNERQVMWEDFGPSDEDLFPQMARTCSFAIHACVVRRDLLREVGGFDPSLRTGEDWDLWLRLARAGARFGHVPRVLAHYRARPGSATMDAGRLVADSLVVLRRAYAADPRVKQPVAAYARGAPAEQFPIARMQNVVWGAGLAIGVGGDGVRFLEGLPVDEIGFDPVLYASCLHGAVIAALGQSHSIWADRFADLEPRVARFLDALEQRSGKPRLARCTLQHLERLVLNASRRPRPFTLRTTHAIDVEVTRPIPRLELAASVERLHCRVHVQDEVVGELELPVFDGCIPASVLADAIAAELAWPILARFFRQHLYPSLTTREEADGWSVHRGELELARGLSRAPEADWIAAHDHLGWTVFLQEAWGDPGLAPGAFYALPPRDWTRFCDPVEGGDGPWIELELSAPRRDLRLRTARARAVLTVGGVPVAQRGLVRRRGALSARAWRVAFTVETGFELCRTCVREALVGCDWSSSASLRQRLAAAAHARRHPAPLALESPPEIELLPSARRVLAERVAEEGSTQVWPHRHFGICGTSTSRRAVLPRELAADLAKLCATSGDPLLTAGATSASQPRLVHAPEVMWRRRRAPAESKRADPYQEAYDGNYFEELFASQPDPWRYETAYETTKYQQTLDLLPQARFRRALEVACAEGHFTVQLAPRCEELVATDISRTALARTRQRCAEHQNIRYQTLDLVHQPLPGRFDLIVCSEVLYYTGSYAALGDVAEKFAQALRPGGFLVMAHAHARVDDPTQPGFTWDVPFGAKVIGEIVAGTRGFRLHRELRTPLYRIQVFQRAPLWRRLLRRPPPQVQVLRESPAPLEPEVAAHVSRPGAENVTTHLPILMYHRVATDGPTALARYRVNPAQFEEQLAYLQSAGYTTASLDEWRRAIATKRPLPGRRIVLTFDDGFRDFFTEAWPLLKRYGLDATVFLPTEHIGGHNRWDAHYGEPAPLMTWDEILQLDREGVQFGSHTLTHPLLTSLPPKEIAEELLRSRSQLQEYLGERILSLAYPFGDHDAVVQSIAGASGYLFGLTCEDRTSCLDDRLLALPRVEVKGGMSLETFRRRLGELDQRSAAELVSNPTREAAHVLK